MDLKEFDLQVIKPSSETPVLVDFWAPWCGPCKFLGPVLDELSNEAQGRWKLVKVNVDESQELATKYGIRGIPNIKLFINGEAVSEQTGALPKPQLEKWLEEQIPDPRSAALEAFSQRLKKGDPRAIGELRAFVEQERDFDEAKLLLAEWTVLTDPEQAKRLTSKISKKENYVHRLSSINDLSELITTPFERNGGVGEKLATAQQLLKSGEMEKALEALIESVGVDKSIYDGLPRRSTIALFNILGPSHELTRSHRRKFDMALY